MAYVPWVPPTSRKPLSPAANELANKIGSLIRDYRGYYPDLSDRDVSEALRAADPVAPEVAGEPARRRVTALLAAALAVGGIVALRAGEGVDWSRLIPPIIAGLAVVAVLLRHLLRAR